LGALLGLIAGVVLTILVVLDPFNLHPIDDRLRGSTGGGELHSTQDETSPRLWTCGMHPNVIEQEPGTCPICQMDLVPVNHDGSHSPEAEVAASWTCPAHEVISETESGTCPICGRDLVEVTDGEMNGDHSTDHLADGWPEIRLDPAVIQKMNVRTASAERRDLTLRIETVGNLDYDEERMVSITTRYPGFVEEVFVNHVGQPVRRGDPLFTVYSPDLVQTQRELVSAVRYAERFGTASPDVRSRAEALVEAARTRLEYWEVPSARVTEIERTGEIQRTLTVHAPADGVVMQRMHGLDGMAISPGMELLHLADMSSLWLRAEVYDHQLPWLNVGSRASVSFDYLPGDSFSGRVRYIEPEVSPATRTVTLTLEVPNPTGRLRVGMFATVEFEPLVAASALVVPTQAVIRSGDRNIAVVSLGDGVFAPREVVLGVESGDWVQIAEGLADDSVIVVSAQFLIDSESNLRAAIGSLLASRGGHDH
jgi:Cu(I)/Ag(I) efflux system membrane fusion protein/cobalt-zinc-cadmium efflux system membrane fusion protein